MKPACRPCRPFPRFLAAGALAALLAIPAAEARGRNADLAEAESLFAAAEFTAAERAFARLHQERAADTLVALRLATLRLLRDDRAAARALAAPLVARHPDSRAARGLLAETFMRDLAFAQAAPHQRALGRAAMAKMLESFGDTVPYRVQGPPATTVRLIQTDPLPLLEARVNGGGPYYFLIDTGAAEVVFDAALADTLGLPDFGQEEGTFAGGRRRAFVRTKLASLTLGEWTIHDLPAAAMDLSRFSAAAGGRRVAGILGTVLFMRCRATLDYPGGALTLAAARRPVRTAAHGAAPGRGADGAAITIPVWIARDHYVLARGRMGGGPERPWFVDTGLAGAAITAPATTLIEAGIPLPDTTSGATGQGGGGAVKVRFFPVDRFQLGAASATGLLGVYGPFPASLERGLGFPLAGIVSHQFFRSWRVTFDFDTMHLVLDPPAARAEGGPAR